ncbi:MAG: hypothetical protein BWY74_03312 [Firmicutes bacterium ADurb.Bin419]|nr:MAG: hypothetical protein BWY74_03312 [Firmicutes bacterium ADurb.Bin419]
MQTQNDEYKVFIDFLNAYNECFYEKDIDKLKRFYDLQNNRLIYIDNHKNNDTYNLEQHLNLLSDFFKNGKKTESGDVEPLIIENLNIFHKEKAACLFYIARYKSFPDPTVRCTLYLECIDNEWKIVHVHCSFTPDK